MLPRLTIVFFVIFLTSRFFTEVVEVLPKWVDVLDIPFVLALGFAALFYRANRDIPRAEHKFIARSVGAVLLIGAISCVINGDDLLLPAAVLFMIGFLQGPLLFVALNKTVANVDWMTERLRLLFHWLLLLNIAVVVFINIPTFIATRDPDVVSGTYGLNAYQFSVLLVLCGALLLGEDEIKGHSRLRTLLGQVAVFVIFYLLQYRAAIPFFLAAYVVMALALYGRRFARVLALGAVVLALGFAGINYVFSHIDQETDLKYGDWQEIASNPGHYLQYGKFLAYSQTAELLQDRPQAALVGVGPGNYLSRAYYTFSYEIASSKDKGVGQLVMRLFGLSGARFTTVSEIYLGPTRTGAVLGSYQLSNANSSYIAPVAEIGLLGGGLILLLYAYMWGRALVLVRLAKTQVREYLPQAIALLAATTYLIGLGFLDNYFEMSRSTLPVWLLFWGTSAGIHVRLKRQAAAEQAVVKPEAEMVG